MVYKHILFEMFEFIEQFLCKVLFKNNKSINKGILARQLTFKI